MNIALKPIIHLRFHAMLNVDMLNVVMLDVMAPMKGR
jgi:hypothetical protein